MPKKGKLKKNFYYKEGGSIQFRKMIRGELIIASTGYTDAYKLNKNATEVRHRIITEHYKLQKEKKSKKPILTELIDKWLAINKQRWQQSTFDTYKHNVHRVRQIGLQLKGSKSRINALRRDWNIFARWAIKQGYKIDLLEGKTNSEGRLRVLSNSEIKLILGAIRADNLRDAVTFAYYTGARLKEINSPDKNNLFINDNNTYLKVIKKGGTERIIKVNHQALDILKARHYMFWSYTKSHISKYFKKYARSIGIEDVQFHDLRRTFGWNLIKQGVPIYQVSKLLGHKSVLTTERHYAPLLTTQIDEFTL